MRKGDKKIIMLIEYRQHPSSNMDNKWLVLYVLNKLLIKQWHPVVMYFVGIVLLNLLKSNPNVQIVGINAYQVESFNWKTIEIDMVLFNSNYY